MDTANKTHLLAISEAIAFYSYLDLVAERGRLVSSKGEWGQNPLKIKIAANQIGKTE